MFISNLEIENDKYYVCGKMIGKYLIKQGLPLLSRKDNKMVFSKTEELQKVISEMPFLLKILVKRGRN